MQYSDIGNMIAFYIIVLAFYICFFIASRGLEKTIHYEEALFFTLLLFVEYLFYDRGLLDIILWIVSLLVVSSLTYLKNRLTGETDSVADYLKKAYLSKNNAYSKFDNVLNWIFILVCYNLINKLGRDSIIVGCIPIIYFFLERGYMIYQNHKHKIAQYKGEGD